MRREPVFEDMAEDFDGSDMRPLAPLRPFRRTRLAGRFVCAASLIAGLSLVARNKTENTAPAPGWVEPRRTASHTPVRTIIQASPSMLAIDALPFEPPARIETPHWSAATGRREDGLAQGQFDAIDAPYLRVTVSETPADETSSSLFVLLARRAADLRGLSVTRTAARGTLDTKFGPFETVEMTLQGVGARQCTGFQSLGSASARIDGWHCGLLGQVAETSTVACSIDRLKLTGPVETAFSEADRPRRSSCNAETAAVSAPPSDDATGSIEKGKPESRARTKKTEAKPRQNTQAGL